MLKPHIHLFTTDCFSEANTRAEDGVQMYAHEFLTLGLLYHEFKDAIREGDGERVFLCWKFFLPIFRADRKSNYAIEAVTYLAEASVLLPPRQREQLLWSRFVNTTGKKGGNVALDLHMEHLNRTVKGVLGRQFSNLHTQSLLRTGKLSGMLDAVCKVFDKESNVHKRSTSHTASIFLKDVKKITDQLTSMQVFTHKSGHFHSSFPNLKCTVTAPLHTRRDEFLT